MGRDLPVCKSYNQLILNLPNRVIQLLVGFFHPSVEETAYSQPRPKEDWLKDKDEFISSSKAFEL